MSDTKNEQPGCVSIFFPFLKFFTSGSTPDSLPYRLRDDFLSPAEFSLYKVLENTLGSDYSIQTKVRLADIFFVSRPDKNMTYFSRIAQRHLDFLVCDSVNMKPLFGIELDDASHTREKRQERDEFVNRVFQTAGLPLLRFKARRDYDVKEISARIEPILHPNTESPSDTERTDEEETKDFPLCPKCGIPMVLRTASKGSHNGEQFYGCKNFPRCREVIPVLSEKYTK